MRRIALATIMILALLGVGAYVLTQSGGEALETSVSLTAQNFSDETHRLRLELSDDSGPVFAEVVDLASGEKRHFEQIAPGGRYTLSATLGADDLTRPISMNDCAEQEISVAVLPSDRLDVQSRRC